MISRKWRLLFIAALFLIGPGILAAAPATRDLFNDTVVHDIKLNLDAADWATLRQNYTDNTYYKGRFSWNEISLDVGIRSRGRGSRSPEKPGLLVNFSKYVKKQAFLGLDKLVLNPGNQDASAMHQAVAFNLFQRAGLPAPRQSFARLFLNGEYFGFYAVVENVDEEFLTRNFGEKKGYLYEWQPDRRYSFEWLGDDPAAYSPVLLGPETHEDDPDPQPFVDLIRAINFTDDAGFAQAISQYLNLNLYLTHASVESVLSEIDGIVGGVSEECVLICGCRRSGDGLWWRPTRSRNSRPELICGR